MSTASQTTAAPSRFAFIHSLRGVAALLVVWCHLSGMWLSVTGGSSTIQTLWVQWVAAPFALYQDGGHLGVILFFMVSGFIVTHTSMRETRTAFMAKRTMRILPPLLVALALSWLLLRVAEATGTLLLSVNNLGRERWLLSALLLDGFAPGSARVLDVTWTLIIEVLFYAMTFVLLGVSRRRPLRALWIMIGIWLALTVFSINVFPISSSPNRVGAAFLGFLILGRVIYLWSQKVVRPVEASICSILVFILQLLAIEAGEPEGLLTAPPSIAIPRIATYLLAPLIFAAMLIAAPARTVQPVKFLGDISYSLYLMHIPVGITAMNLLTGAGMSVSVSTLLAIALSIAVAWVTYRLIELPSQRLVRWLLKPRTVAYSSSVAPQERNRRLLHGATPSALSESTGPAHQQAAAAPVMSDLGRGREFSEPR